MCVCDILPECVRAIFTRNDGPLVLDDVNLDNMTPPSPKIPKTTVAAAPSALALRPPSSVGAIDKHDKATK